MNTPKDNYRQILVESVKSPLGFFVLIALAVESILTALVLVVTGTDRTFLLIAMTTIFVLLILVVGWITAKNPGAITYRGQPLRVRKSATKKVTKSEHLNQAEVESVPKT